MSDALKGMKGPDGGGKPKLLKRGENQSSQELDRMTPLDQMSASIKEIVWSVRTKIAPK